MAIRYYKPTSPGRRAGSVSDFSEITDPKKEPEKRLSVRLRKKGGRNFQGRITARHRGGGHKKIYRKIDFDRNKDGVPASVAFIEYDPNRSARIALLHYADGEKRYILAPEGLKVGDKVQSGARRRAERRQLHAAGKNPARDAGALHRDAARQRRANVPHGRRARRHERPRGKVGPDHASFRRSAAASQLLPGDDRRDRKFRPHQRVDRQGGSQAVDGPPSACSRRRHESGRPSDGRRRRPHVRADVTRAARRACSPRGGGRGNAASRRPRRSFAGGNRGVTAS